LINLPQVAAFTGASAAVAWSVSEAPVSAWRLLAAFGLLSSFFFRLRVFDEVKDFETDRTVNPHRPLARGMISVQEAKAVAWLLLVPEGVLAVLLGGAAGSAWAVSAGYSLVMYREFFVGAWLRPRMELYAVTHTFVAGLLSATVYAMVLPQLGFPLPHAMVWFALASWGVFNVYEFARKTFAASEEQPGVESYSSRLGSWGAATLIVSQGAAAIAFAWPLPLTPWARAGHLCLFGLLASAGVLYSSRRSAGLAAGLRAMAGVFILGFYLLVGAGLPVPR
jgi:4-hydroxybenzoate polyprenyltransferase